LLANIYMRRFVLGWKMFGLERTLGTRLVTYASDRSRRRRRGSGSVHESAARASCGNAPRAPNPGKELIFRVSMLPTRRRGRLRRFLSQGWTKGSESGGAGEIDFAALKQEARARLAASKRGA
jgi:hypothetical protein